MLYLGIKAALSGVIIAIVSEVAPLAEPRRAHRVIAAGFDPRNTLALA